MATTCGVSWRAWSTIRGRTRSSTRRSRTCGRTPEEMQERSEDLGDRIEETRSDWHRKQQDDAVPGAQPPPDDEAKHPLSKPT